MSDGLDSLQNIMVTALDLVSTVGSSEKRSKDRDHNAACLRATREAGCGASQPSLLLNALLIWPLSRGLVDGSLALVDQTLDKVCHEDHFAHGLTWGAWAYIKANIRVLDKGYAEGCQESHQHLALKCLDTTYNITDSDTDSAGGQEPIFFLLTKYSLCSVP